MGDRVAAVILSGGSGTRLGGMLKSEIRVAGERLLDRVLRRLSDCSLVVVAHGPHDPEALSLPPGVLAVADGEGGVVGPLAGVLAVASALEDRADLLLSVAVDTPFLPPDYVGAMSGGLGDGVAAVASYDGQLYPTNSIWRLDSLIRLMPQLRSESGPRSLKELAADLSAREVVWPVNGGGNPFANVNTPQELAAAQVRAKGF